MPVLSVQWALFCQFSLTQHSGWHLVENLEPNLQVILLEHANLRSDKRFQSYIVDEEWRNGKALIPQEWINHH